MRIVLAAIVAQARTFGVGGVQNLALAGGVALVSHGVGRVYAPAGEIVAGGFALALAWLFAKAAV